MNVDVERGQILWQQLLARLELAQEVPPLSFNMWFRPSVAVAVVDDALVVQAANRQARDFMTDRWENIVDSLLHEMGESLHVSFIVESENPIVRPDTGAREASGLNPHFKFENFIVGDSNSFAHAAAKAVAENPSNAYNPLFLYGGTGLGKTHLMHAIGNLISANNPTLQVMYVTSEQFTNEIIAAIQKGPEVTAAFRARYRHVDVLIIDDIQLLAGREKTQNEVFNTFNDLHTNQKQIILSSDRPPREIQHLEERLRSRFEMGLQADVQPPDLDTRIAILSKRASDEGVEIPSDVLQFMAEFACHNVRELEGTYNRVCAYARLTFRPIDFDLARDALRTFTAIQAAGKVSPDDILQAVADTQGISPEILKSAQRTARVALARQMAMFLMREMTDLSLPRIGHFFDRDHTTVLHGLDKMERLMAQNVAIRQEITNLRNRLAKSEQGR